MQEGLSRYGEVVPVPQLYSWLGTALDRDDTCLLEEKHKQAIRKWLEAHPDRIFDMLVHWITQTPASDLERKSYRFHERILEIDWPTGFGQRFLGLAATQENDEIAVFLFREAVRLRTWRDRADAPTLEEFIHFVEDHPRFQAALDPELYYLIPDWRLERLQRRENHRREREGVREERVRWVVGNLAKIRSGTHIAGLNMLAKAYFGLFIEVDRNSDPRGRIASITNDECAEAALEGFVATLYQQHPEAPTPAMIGDVHSRSREFPFGFVILAGMDLLSQQSMDKVKTLPDSMVGSGNVRFMIGCQKYFKCRLKLDKLTIQVSC